MFLDTHSFKNKIYLQESIFSRQQTTTNDRILGDKILYRLAYDVFKEDIYIGSNTVPFNANLVHLIIVLKLVSVEKYLRNPLLLRPRQHHCLQQQPHRH